MLSPRRIFMVTVCCLAGTWLPTIAMTEETQMDAAVKAGLVFNFAKFIDWPVELREGQEFQICISTDRESLAAGFASLQGKSVQGHEIRVRRISSKDDPGPCHVLMFSSSDGRGVAEALRSVQGHAVLTVGDTDGFADAGGMINLVTVDRHIRFDLNIEAARHSSLRINAQLIALARNVIGR